MNRREYLLAITAGSTGFAASSASARGTVVPECGLRGKRFFSNDDGNSAMMLYGGSFRPGMVTDSIDVLVGTPVTTYVLSVTYSDVLTYPSKVEEMFGWRETPSTRPDGSDAWYQRVYEFYQYVRQQGWDIPRMAQERASAKGLEFIPSMRMNDAHFAQKVKPTEHPLTGRFWMEHQDLTINPQAKWPSTDRPGQTGYDRDRGYHDFVLDFRHPAVREYRMKMALEIVDRYGTEGFEMDWTRHYKFFRSGHEQPELITDMVREVRLHLDKRSGKRGRPPLIARVAASVERNESIGLDVRTWVREKLIDYLVPSSPSRYMSFDMPIAEWVELTKGTGIKVHASPDSGSYRGYGSATLEMYRAAAANYYAAGAEGVYLFNFNAQRGSPGPMPDDSYVIFRDVSDPDALVRRDKLFQATLDNWRKDTDTLPVALSGPDRLARLGIAVGDDVVPALRSASLKDVLLRAHVVGLTHEDRFEIEFNGRPLDNLKTVIPDDKEMAEWKNGIPTWTYEESLVKGIRGIKGPWAWIEADLRETLPRRGDNIVTIRRLSGSNTPINLTDLDIRVRYDYFGPRVSL